MGVLEPVDCLSSVPWELLLTPQERLLEDSSCHSTPGLPGDRGAEGCTPKEPGSTVVLPFAPQEQPGSLSGLCDQLILKSGQAKGKAIIKMVQLDLTSVG